MAYDAKGADLITIRDVSIQLNQEQFALKDISLTLASAKIHAVIGPNGSGKTTLLKCVAGLYQPMTDNRIHINQQLIEVIFKATRSITISYVESQHLAAFAFPVRDIILWGRWSRHYGRPTSEDYEHVKMSSELLGVSELLERSFTSLSTGERKKVMLAQSLASGARLFIWDEPFAPLDLKSSKMLITTMKKLVLEGATFLVSFHDLPLALRHADTMTLLDRGHLNWSGLTNEDQSIVAIESVFGVAANPGGLYFV